ncbi:MAG: fatty acid desaturase [Gammaproteobacteria bacterium]|nr:fatty acid desaturase [Gammaproteobacteria bacterium]
MLDHAIVPRTLDMPEHSAGIRVGKDLLKATLPFAIESVATSWWQVGLTFLLLIAALMGAGFATEWPLRVLFSCLGALMIVRAFITYHDFMHGALLRDSRLAAWIFQIYAAFGLAPSRSWKQSHNYHHGHIGQVSADSIGAFPLMTVQMWRVATPAARLRYRIERHPLTVLAGYLTIFLLNICLLPLLRDPKRHWDSALSLLAHGGLIGVLWVYGGFDVAFFAVLLPMTIAAALGSYLFFAQHSFKRMIILSPEAWTFYRAALMSSSYMRLNKILQWFTGNIGYHHIHHLNVRIPFYRLPEAMAAIPELQSPITTSLAPREIINCFRSSLWDEDRQRMVAYSDAK